MLFQYRPVLCIIGPVGYNVAVCATPLSVSVGLSLGFLSTLRIYIPVNTKNRMQQAIAKGGPDAYFESTHGNCYRGAL